MMKKRLLAALLCAVLLFSGLPVVPFSLGTAITAAAAADVTKLKELVDSVPNRSSWDKIYVDSTALSLAYKDATDIIASPEKYEQKDANKAEAALQTALNSIQYHTLGLSVNPRETTLPVGGSTTLTVTKDPSNGIDPVNWVSNNTAVADVDSTGKVTVKKYSDKPVLISAVSNGTSNSCTLRTTNPVAGVRLSETSISMLAGKEVTLKAEPFGADPDAEVTDKVDYTSWHSDDEKIATVSEYGTVKGVSAGVANITVSITSGGKSFTADCVATVGRVITLTAINPVTVKEGETLSTTVGATELIILKVEPNNASDKSLKWSSSDTNIATVGDSTVKDDEVSAKITVLKEGTATITYTASDGSGLSGSFNITASPAVTFIQVSPEKVVVTPSTKDQKVTAKILPEDAGNQVVKWESDNTNVCEVNYSGVLNPKMIGTCNVKAITTDGSNLSGQCFVRVADPASAVSVDKESLTLKVGDTANLKGTVRTTSGTTYNDVEWVSSDAAVATVDSKGHVEAVGPGTTSIMAVALDGTEKSAVCAVSVTAAVESIELEKEINLDVGTTATLTPTFVPANATDKKVTWVSSNPDVASVSNKGVVSGKTVGTATITCAAASGAKASCNVHVVNPVTGIKLSEKSLVVSAGETKKLTATVTPDNATDKSVTWTSSDEKVATVSKDGSVKGVAGGKCTITAKTNSGGKTATCSVSVTQGVSGIHFEKERETMYESETLTLEPVITPITATDTKVTWKSSDTKVANVNASGVVTARAAGTAIITATTADGGFSDSVTITVTKRVPVTGIYIPYNKISLQAGNTYTISAQIYPSNASNRNILWESSDTSVAAVFKGGEVSANGPGTATITATTEDGGFSYRCTVTVTQSVEGVKLSKSKLSVAVGSSKTLTATTIPANATNQKITWYSADKSIATVSQKGIVTGKKPGTTTVTVTSDEGNYSAECTVEVYTPGTGIKINSEKITLGKGQKTVLTATVMPENATNKNVEWSSSDASVVTVNASGQISGVKVGSAVITATTSDKKYKDTCLVEVVQLATEVILDFTNLQMDVGKTKTLTASLRPMTITNKKVKWSSSDKKIASIDSNGTIKALKAGTVTIKCASADGGAKATCKVTVIQRVTSIKFKNPKETVKVGAKKILAVTMLPKDASETTFNWKSSNKKIAKVNSKGKVLGVAPGTCTIKVSNAAGTVKAKCTLTVTKGVEGIELDKAAISISKGKSTTLRAIITPKDATNQGVTWTSSNNDVATVNAKGKVKAKAIGYAVITATTKDTGAQATCKVRVVYGVTGVSLDQTKLKLNVGKKQTLKATLSPTKATNKNLIWKSSNKNVARVSQTGLVKALRAGKANITVTTEDGGYKAVCKVVVVVPVKGISLSRTKLTLEKGKVFKLKAKLDPTDATVKTVKWITGDKSIVAVDQTGKIKAMSPGTTLITAKTKDGGFTAKCKVSVYVSPTAVKVSPTKLTIGTGRVETLTATVLPEDAPQTVTWSTSNAQAVAVSQTGQIRGKGSGSAVITATTGNGKTATCVISVQEVLTELVLNKNALSLAIGQTGTLKASAKPEGLSNGTLSWKTSNAKVATVNSKGIVTAVAPGNATITVYNKASGLSDTCAVAVRRPVTGVKLNETTLRLNYQETATLTATVSPRNATNQTILWESNNTKIAKVSKSGVVTGVGGGKAIISAITDDGGYAASCEVYVNVPVTGITLTAPQKTVNVGNTIALSAATVPAGASNQTIEFTSSDVSIAKVNSAGVVTGIQAGAVTITAKSAEGDYTKSVILEVVEAVTSITFKESTFLMSPGNYTTLNPVILPETAADKTLNWSSSDTKVATVDENGRVKAIAPGEATITAVSRNSGASNYVTVRVVA